MSFDLHTHTTYSDGADSPEEMILAAIALGMEKIGISDHSYTAFDPNGCIQKERIQDYRREILALKEKYAGKIKVLLGIEQDYYSSQPTDGYDYVIGSVHYFKFGDEYIAVDQTPEIQRSAADKYCGGDFYKLCEVYYSTVADVVEKTGCDVIGHFDLIKKYNRGNKLFDENSERYREIVIPALDKLISSGKIFEINTGALARKYRDDTYPSPEWIEYIKARGGKFILSSDSHKKETLLFGFSGL